MLTVLVHRLPLLMVFGAVVQAITASNCLIRAQLATSITTICNAQQFKLHALKVNVDQMAFVIANRHEPFHNRSKLIRLLQKNGINKEDKTLNS